LLFSLRKFKQSSDQIQVSSRREPGRNPEDHLRVIGIRVELKLGVETAKLEHLDRIFKSFREFFTVPSIVSLGIPVLFWSRSLMQMEFKSSKVADSTDQNAG
jgi:hypothetical protein